MGTPRNKPRTVTPRQEQRAKQRAETKQVLRSACEAITGTTLTGLLESAPSFKSQGNLRAKVDTTDPDRKYHAPTAQQLKEAADYFEVKGGEYAALAAQLRGCIQDESDVKEIVTGASKVSPRTSDADDHAA